MMHIIVKDRYNTRLTPINPDKDLYITIVAALSLCSNAKVSDVNEDMKRGKVLG